MSSVSKPDAKGANTAPARMGASPLVAAAFLAGIVYLWVETLFRLVFTYTNLANSYVLWQGRVGDIAAMWLTMWVVAIVVFFIFGYGVFRRRPQVGTIWLWMIVLIVSAIVAPLIGEIGTPIGILDHSPFWLWGTRSLPQFGMGQTRTSYALYFVRHTRYVRFQTQISAAMHRFCP